MPILQKHLAKRLSVPGAKLRPVRESLTQNELIIVTAPAEGQAGGQLLLTPAGQQTLDKLAAYHDSLAELLDGWSPEQEAELATLLRRVATNLLSRQNFPAASFIHPSQHDYLTKKKWYIYFL